MCLNLILADQSGTQQRWEFLDVWERYEHWLDGHRREYRPRGRSSAKRDIGEKCGPWDDRYDAVPKNDQYDLDDPFIDDSEVEEDPSNEAGPSTFPGSLVVQENGEDVVPGGDAESATATSGTGSRATSEAATSSSAEARTTPDSADDHHSRDTRRGPHVLEIPVNGPTPDAAHLFDDEMSPAGSPHRETLSDDWHQKPRH